MAKSYSVELSNGGEAWISIKGQKYRLTLHPDAMKALQADQESGVTMADISYIRGHRLNKLTLSQIENSNPVLLQTHVEALRLADTHNISSYEEAVALVD